MKLQLKKDKKANKHAVTITLSHEGDDVFVMAVDKNDAEWYLAIINQDGTMTKCGCLPERLGFQLNKDGKIKKKKKPSKEKAYFEATKNEDDNPDEDDYIVKVKCPRCKGKQRVQADDGEGGNIPCPHCEGEGTKNS